MKKKPAKSTHKSKQYCIYYLGPLKIKDGLYIGNQIASKVFLIHQDIKFVTTNKVTHIINCACKKISNTWQKSGIQYLNFNWLDNQTKVYSYNQVLQNKNTLNTIQNFIEDALENGVCCLVISMHGKSRAITVVASYLMKKYKWSLYKTLEFLNSKKSEFQIRQNFFKQLQHLQHKLQKITNLSNDWNFFQNNDVELRNTFLNQKISLVKQNGSNKKQRKRKIAWLDQQTNNKKKVFQYIPLNKNEQVITKISNPKIIQQNKPILKHSQSHHPPEKNQITNISGNTIKVTVNNFINTDNQKHFVNFIEKINQKKEARPYSSDIKDKNKKVQKQRYSICLYDPFPKNFKTPFQTKISLKTKSIKIVKTSNSNIKTFENVFQTFQLSQIECSRNQNEFKVAKQKISKPYYYFEDKKRIRTSVETHKKVNEMLNIQKCNNKNFRYSTPSINDKQKQKEEFYNRLNRTDYKWK